MSLFHPPRIVSLRCSYQVPHPYSKHPSLVITRLKSTYSTTTSTTLRPSQPFNTTINPPHTTRPPPLHLPTRNTQQPTLSYYYSLAKSYLTFYKTALSHIRANWRDETAIRKRIKQQSADINSAIKAQRLTVGEVWDLGNQGPQITRAEWQTLRRSSRDKRRLPLFLGLFAITFEFFPLIVYVFSKQLVSKLPEVVLQPSQEVALRRQIVERWKRVEEKYPEGVKGDDYDGYVNYMADFHGLAPKWIPRVLVPGYVLAARVNRHVEYLRYDDQLLGKNSVSGLIDEEVVIAAVERGLWEESVDMETLRGRVQDSVNRSWDMESEMKKELEKGRRK